MSNFDDFDNDTPPQGGPEDDHDAELVMLAERQAGGRGRRGREWASPLAAHVYLSLARRFAGGLARPGGLSPVSFTDLTPPTICSV